MINVGIVGGTGYTGVELLRILAHHPEIAIKAVTSRSDAGMAVSELYPNLRGAVDRVYCKPPCCESQSNRCEKITKPGGMVVDTPGDGSRPFAKINKENDHHADQYGTSPKHQPLFPDRSGEQ